MKNETIENKSNFVVMNYELCDTILPFNMSKNRKSIIKYTLKHYNAKTKDKSATHIVKRVHIKLNEII